MEKAKFSGKVTANYTSEPFRTFPPLNIVATLFSHPHTHNLTAVTLLFVLQGSSEALLAWTEVEEVNSASTPNMASMDEECDITTDACQEYQGKMAQLEELLKEQQDSFAKMKKVRMVAEQSDSKSKTPSVCSVCRPVTGCITSTTMSLTTLPALASLAPSSPTRSRLSQRLSRYQRYFRPRSPT